MVTSHFEIDDYVAISVVASSTASSTITSTATSTSSQTSPTAIPQGTDPTESHSALPDNSPTTLAAIILSVILAFVMIGFIVATYVVCHKRKRYVASYIAITWHNYR